MELTAVIVAAGSGRRMGFDKLTVPLAGRTVVEHSLAAFEDCPEVTRIILVANAERLDAFERLARAFPKVTRTVAGGRERAESVWHGLRALAGSEGFVAVHDAARPLILPETITACFALARERGSAVCAEPCSDTLHRGDCDGNLTETVPRSSLWRMQTPQIFPLAELRGYYAAAVRSGADATDEAGLAIRHGKHPAVYGNPHCNLKLTHPADVPIVRRILEERHNPARTQTS